MNHMYSEEERRVAIEILTIDLSEATIDAIANRVVQLMSDKSGSVSPEPRRTQRAEVSSEEADPWANEGPTEPGGSRQSRDASLAQPAARPTTGSRAASDSDVKTVKTKNGVQTWRFPADAPECECGEPAGLVSGTSDRGKRWKAFRCAKASGDGWRDKCDYNEFTR